MDKVTLQDLVTVLREKNGLKKRDAQQFVTALFDVIKEGLYADKLVKVKGLGTFKIIVVEARESVNVNTGERVKIDRHSKLTFTPDATMKELVNKPFSGFETVALKDGVVFDDMADDVRTESESEESEVDEVEMIEEPVAVEPEPEPVVEETEPEPVAEEPEPIVEDPEPEPEIEEPTSDTADEPVVEMIDSLVSSAENENVDDTVEQQQNQNDDETMENNDENKKERSKWIWLCPLLMLVSGMLGFWGGYEARYYYEPMHYYQNIDTILVQDSLPVDTDSVTVGVNNGDSIQAPEAKKPKQAVTVKNDTVDYRTYERMDARVRTGAYRIVGTDRVIKTTPGETLGYIAGRTLGPDMVCYLEVYNGIKSSTKSLEPGTLIKIPKLELKKKKKKTQK
jgi:nucleoid DNA-binding protein